MICTENICRGGFPNQPAATEHH